MQFEFKRYFWQSVKIFSFSSPLTAAVASLSFTFPLMEFQSVAAVVEFLQWGSQATLVFSNTKLSSVDVERCCLLHVLQLGY